MEFRILGWSDAGPTLELDHRRFPYAGKFVMTNTGKAVAAESSQHTERESPPAGKAGESGTPAGVIVAAASFSPDRTEPGTIWIRYLTVRHDRQGDGIGPRLARYVSTQALDRGFEQVRIGVNNPLSYEALYKAGFAFTGEETGLAELVLERPGESDRATYQSGLNLFRDRDLSDPEERFLSRKRSAGPPEPIEPSLSGEE